MSRQIREENTLLRTQQISWLIERERLTEKTNLARVRIETVVGRLRKLDNKL